MGGVTYLLDTHVFLWAIRESKRLSATAREALLKPDAECFISAASAYEIMNKYRMGKLPDYTHVADHYLEILKQFGARELPVRTAHAHLAGKLEWSHRDPFDRLIAAQAIHENMILISGDAVFCSLDPLTVLW